MSDTTQIDKTHIDRLIQEIRAAAARSPEEELVAAGLVTTEEAAEFLGISRSKLYEMMGERRISFVQVDRNRRIPRNELVRLAAAGLVMAINPS